MERRMDGWRRHRNALALRAFASSCLYMAARREQIAIWATRWSGKSSVKSKSLLFRVDCATGYGAVTLCVSWCVVVSRSFLRGRAVCGGGRSNFAQTK